MRLAGFEVCAVCAYIAVQFLHGIFSGMRRKSVLGDMAFPSYDGISSCRSLSPGFKEFSRCKIDSDFSIYVGGFSAQ